MSEIVNEDQALLAAEFVLGTLDPHERARANGLLGSDEAFAELVSLWERRLGELHLMVEPVEPNPTVWQRIRQRVLGVPAIVEEPPRIETPPQVEVPEVVPAPFTAGAPEPPREIEKPREPEQLPQAEVAEAAPASTPEPVQLEAGGGGPFAALEAALQPAAPRAEPVVPAPPPSPPPPEMPNEPSSAPKRLIVHDLRAEREALTAGELRGRKGAARGAGAWRALGPLMTLIAAALAGLIVAWRYVPDRLPPRLQPSVLLNMAPTPANAAKKPPRSLTPQFEE